ncbi:MAG TPA: response regulator transcription factor, partial [Verrucomicrobiaceae bacterium]
MDRPLNPLPLDAPGHPVMKQQDGGQSPPAGVKRILIVDDHPVIRRGLTALLSTAPEFAVCGEADTAATALDAMRRLSPDVVLADVAMPGTNGIELIKLMLAERPKLLILTVSMHDESLYAMRALRAGAKGYVTKSETQNHLIEALRKIMNGGLYVSPQYSERLINNIV